MSSNEDFAAAVRQHDEQIAALGLTISVGSEPTFTDRSSQSPEWLTQATGGDKEQRARGLLSGLQRRSPGALLLRSVGRQYPGEALPRWNLGLYGLRDGKSIWAGPPDPLLSADIDEDAEPCDLSRCAAALAAAMAAHGWQVEQLAIEAAHERRLLMRTDTAIAAPDAADPRLHRPSVHAEATPASGLRDELAVAGAYLFVLHSEEKDGAADARSSASIELPMLADVALFLAVVESIAEASLACQLPTLILAGYPPPVDIRVQWTTVTPDPAVVEINSAPSLDAVDFLACSRAVYAAAAEQDLAPYRLYFNGEVADSGGGGQITLGGPSAATSPFLQDPQLLPSLVRFHNRHPALSYLYSHDFVGSSGQSVRPDERGVEAFDELSLALALLEREKDLSPELLWRSLAPFLCDASGNSHRAEMNIEKLWNPFLAGRGKQGLVEFRALRMQHTPERATALVCLLRAVVAMLAGKSYRLPLIDWGRELHQRFALPFYLEQDLETVLAELASAGLGLGEAIEAVLRREEFRPWGQVTLPGCTLEVRQALEFWPLLGDSASPDQGGSSRLVDASTARVELRLRPAPDDQPGRDDWQLFAAGVALPMRQEGDRHGALQVFGLRYRSFVPSWGLYPTLPRQVPVRLRLRHPEQSVDHVVTLQHWHPDGAAYAGLPEDLAAASRRRSERVTTAIVPRDPALTMRWGPLPGLGPYSLDLRYLAD